MRSLPSLFRVRGEVLKETQVMLEAYKLEWQETRVKKNLSRMRAHQERVLAVVLRKEIKDRTETVRGLLANLLDCILGSRRREETTVSA